MRKLLIVCCLSLLGLAGCGDDGGGDVDVASDKKGDPGDPEFTGKAGKDFCDYLRDLDKRDDQLSLSGEDSDDERKKAREGLEILDDLEDKAPPEIKADVVLVIKQVRPIFEAIAAGETYEPKPEDAPSEAEQKEFEAAGERVEAYSANVCGIKDEDAPDSSETSDTSEAPPEDEQAPAEEDLPPDE